jgi:SNF2 family DNA or RNA helicase
MRGARKYERKKDPFTSILWWRVVMDEVQMIQAANTNAAEMAAMLPAINKWGASGTPMRAGHWHDLHGLISFLGIQELLDAWKGLMSRINQGGEDAMYAVDILVDTLSNFTCRHLKVFYFLLIKLIVRCER